MTADRRPSGTTLVDVSGQVQCMVSWDGGTGRVSTSNAQLRAASARPPRPARHVARPDAVQWPLATGGRGHLSARLAVLFAGPERFSLYLTRQFTHEEEGEYAGMEQLQCIIYYEPAPELRALDRNLWSSTCASRADFFARVEAMPEFRIPVERHTALRAELEQENV